MDSSNHCVLLIDDNPGNLDNFTELLELEGYQVLSSKNGEEGINLAKLKLPALIISDIKLPGIDGFALLQYFKNNSRTENIPFVFLSAFSEKEMIRKSMALGASDYLIKPCCTEEMLSSISKLFSA